MSTIFAGSEGARLQARGRTWKAGAESERGEPLFGAVAQVVDWTVQQASMPVSVQQFERALWWRTLELGRYVLELFLALCAERDPVVAHEQRGARRWRPGAMQSRTLNTLFGAVTYRRRYMRELKTTGRRGFFPLDVALGLTSEQQSLNLLSEGCWLAMRMSYEEARTTLGRFHPTAPSTEVLEKAVLGFGQHSGAWFEQAPPPAEDGEVLIVMADSKGVPTASATELERRRGRRRRRDHSPSPRHRGRERRRRYVPKPRRRKGDKSKNAKMATMVVMYTLRREGERLLGPLNRRVYASFGPKRHSFEIARREALKRGFGPGSGKQIQIVLDGDRDLACYAREFFPGARLTIDIMHVLEKLWSAGEALYPEGSAELKAWVHAQRKLLYRGKAALLMRHVQRRLDAIAKTGPGNKGKRTRLGEVVRYLSHRLAHLNYGELRAQDLELSSGPVEGLIKNLIGKRFDHGGMRWIQERAEALLQLRCIDANDHWDPFVLYVHNALQHTARQQAARLRLQTSTPRPLPGLKRTD